VSFRRSKATGLSRGTKLHQAAIIFGRISVPAISVISV
jgi:hypothetical protein